MRLEKLRRTSLVQILTIAFSLAVMGAVTGCNDIEELSDCTVVCDNHQECVDEEYDVSACIDTCEEQSDTDADYAQRVDECEACVDDRACAESSVVCATDCLGVVP